MAETALYLALRKISTASRRDDSSSNTILLESFRSRLRRIESEVRMIYCFLDQRETRYSNNQMLLSWIAEARRLGHLVEETVDVHIYSIFHSVFGSGAHWIARLSLPGQILMRRRAFIGMIELEEELQHLSEMKRLWIREASDPEPGYIPSISETETAYVSYQKLLSDLTIQDPMRFNVERPELNRLLERIDGGGRQVVAVCGQAGSGKTTLVRSVYEQQRKHFDCWAWISMSSGASAKDILSAGDHVVRRSAEALRLDDLRLDHDIDREPLKHLAEALTRGGLSEKRFLIVFDGVNVKDGISEVCSKLVQSRSRIIVVTRIQQVATEVDEAPIKLAGLEPGEALELFHRVVFGKEPDVTWNDPNAEEICHKCKGSPQAIISLGASLSLKQNTQSTFQQVKKQLEWVSKNNSVLVDDTSKCLYVAYINLPKHLKVCLLYCGIFPAGRLLLRENLVRLMVAEGFTEKQRPSEVDEEIAEGYLMELSRWGFLHLVDRDDLGRVTSLRMPTIVHDLVRSISRKEGFGMASDGVELAHTDTDVRCLFISKYPEDILSLTELTHMRTLITGESAHEVCAPGNAVEYFLKSLCLKRYTIITVLDLQGSILKEIPVSIGRLFNLRYLALRKTKIQSLPDSMGSLHNMQTLDLESSNRFELSSWIRRLARLRHLLARHLIDEGNRGKILMGVRVPSLRRMTELQTLGTVEAGESFVMSVDKLTQLRSLRVISNVDSKSWRSLLSKMSKLRSLASFAVTAKDDDEVLDLSGDPIEQLKTLELSCCKLGNDPIKSLSKKFPNLVSLSLYKVSGISELKFQDDYFPKLRILNLRGMGDVKQLQIPVGELASLDVLRVEGLTELNVDTVGQLDKIRSIKKCFFPQLRGRLETTDVPESSSRAAQL